MSIFGPIHLQHWYPNYPNVDIYILDVKSNVNIRTDPFATLVPKLPKSGYIFWMLNPMSIFGPIHLQHWYPNYPNLDIYIPDVKSNVNIRTVPFATLVPKLPHLDIYIFWMLNPMSIFGPIHLQHWYPNYPNLDIYILNVKSNVNIRTDPLATLVPKLPKSGYIYSGC
jgi:hypothetical protein